MNHRERNPDSIEELKRRNLSVECPYCHMDIIAEPVTEPVVKSDYVYFVALCPHHKDYGRYCKPFFLVYQPLNDCITERYPLPKYQWATYHESIPDNIRQDYAESMKCLGATAYKATVALCRRTIEAVCWNKIGDDIKKEFKEKDIKLWMLIDKLKEKGLITEDLRQTAHEIRHLGNYGAHFQDDELDTVKIDEAREIQEFVGHLLSNLYITPYKTTKRREQREKNKSS